VEYGDSVYYYYHTAVVTGIPDAFEAGVAVYPNPSSGKVTISSKSPISGLEIYNLAGNRVYSDPKIKQQTSKEINLTAFPKGIYFVKVYTGTKSQIRKVVVQ
jgi:hypothetical protein